MRAAVLRETGVPFSIEEVELLAPTDGRVVVRTHASPFCSTDVHNWSGALAKIPPTILGHASIGEVVEVGPGVRTAEVGQRVLVPGTPECGTCYYCSVGEPWQCSELFDLGGVYPDVARGADGALISGAGCVGGYAELMNVSQNQVFPVESELDSDTLSLLGCGITTGYGAVVNAARLRPGESVAVFGAGHLGLWMLQAARVARASFVAVVEPDARRREVARSLGADVVIDPDAEDAVASVQSLTGGRGADVTLEASSSTKAQRAAVLAVRRSGRAVLSGLERGDAEVSIPQVPLALQSRSVISVQNGNVRMRRDVPACIRLLEQGLLDATPIITNRYSVDRLDEAREASKNHDDLSGLVVFAH
jgi:S-(hydroxymethyl)glutathione dehydrogenase/alcohol dehydrogenase